MCTFLFTQWLWAVAPRGPKGLAPPCLELWASSPLTWGVGGGAGLWRTSCALVSGTAQPQGLQAAPFMWRCRDPSEDALSLVSVETSSCTLVLDEWLCVNCCYAVESLSRVQLCAPLDCSPPGYSREVMFLLVCVSRRSKNSSSTVV